MSELIKDQEKKEKEIVSSPPLPTSHIHSVVQTPSNKIVTIPEVPKQKKGKGYKLKEKENIKEKIHLLNNDLRPKLFTSEYENLYWRLAWLQFIILSLGYWASLINGYNVDIGTELGFWAGVSAVDLKTAIYGTVTSFTNVVIGGVMKLYNRRIDEKHRDEEKSKNLMDHMKIEKEVAEDNNKKKDKRILDLETQILNLSLKMQKIIEKE